MRLLPWLLLLIALAGAAALARLVVASATRSPADYLAEADGLLARVPPDPTGALRELRFGIALAERDEDDAALIDLLEARGQLYRRQRALEPASADFERLLALPGADTTEAYVELAELALLAGDLEAVDELVAQILLESPTESRALECRGEAARERADRLLEEARTLIEVTLPESDAKRALALADRVAHLPASAPLRAASLNEFGDLFSGPFVDSLEELRPRLLAAGEQVAAARTDFVAALTHGMRRDSAYLLLDILLRAGSDETVVDLGLALRPFPAVGRDLRSVQLIGRALALEGRPRAAAQVVETAAQPGDITVPKDFLPTWAEILYANETWGALLAVASDMTLRFASGEKLQAERDAADFYRGMAQFHGQLLGPASTSLRAFVNGDPVQPVPGAVATAWRTLADIERVAGGEPAYFEALKRLVANAPDDSGPAWLELADLRERDGSQANDVLLSLTQAIRLLPERLEELLPRWHEFGQRTLDESGRDLDQIGDALMRRGQWTSPDNTNPYEQFRLAQRWVELGRSTGVISACQRILDRYPRFLPAYDLLVDTYLSLGREDLAVPLLVERQGFAPNDPRGIQLLRDLDAAGRLTPAQRQALMRIDPRYTGLIHLAPALLEQDRARLVAQAFSQLGADLTISGAILLAARAELMQGNSARVLELLEPIDRGDPNYSEAFALRVVAARSLGPTRLRATIEDFAAPDYTDLEPLLSAVETLLLEERPDEALLLIEALDADASTRDDALVARRSLAELMARDFVAARESLERALAFRSDGFVEMGELLMTVQEERWSDLRRASLAARAAAPEADVFESCLLSALEGRSAEALAIALEGEVNAVAGAPWGLARAAIEVQAGEPIRESAVHGAQGAEATERMLIGTRENPRDPRTTLAVLLALRTPDWAPWANSVLAEAGPEAGSLWPGYLRALVERTLGADASATARLRALTQRAPDFAPAWIRLEELELERLGRIEHPTLLALRAARAAALGAPPGESAEARLARASTLVRNGRLAEAAELAGAVLDGDPGDLVARLLLGRIELAIGQVGEAVRTFGRFFAAADPELSAEYVPEFLTLIELARVGGALSEGAFAVELEALEARHPRDPAIVTVRAEREIRLAGGSLDVGLGRAWRMLDRFEQSVGETPLDELRPGSSESWFALLLSYDPDRAEAFARAQLERNPTSLELWMMLGRAYEAQGRRLDAIEHYERLAQMVPDTRALRRMADLIAELGSDHRRVNQLVERIRVLDGGPGEDPSLELVEARSMVNAGGSLLDVGLERLSALWNRREEVGRAVSTVQLAHDYGTGLLHRADVRDRGRARAVLETGLALLPEGAPDADIDGLLASLAPRIPAAAE